MSDDNGARSPGTLPAMNPAKGPAGSTPIQNAPPGHAFRRAVTVDETAQFRRRPPFTHLSTENSFEGPKRRGSTFSDYSLSEARDLLNPKPVGAPPAALAGETSNWASIPLAFALLPAVGGMLFKNGSAIVTDIMLLGLAAVFLHWSVTQPWNWYHSAQGLRVREEINSEAIVDDESENEHIATPTKPPNTNLEDVPEESTTPSSPMGEEHTKTRSTRTDDALAELYLHEVMALISCFLFPILGAYLLHAIRTQLSRPSEGLVSNYNLTIFLLAAELRPLSHMIKLVQSRTLHLQRVVQSLPFKEGLNADQVKDVLARLEALESRPPTDATARTNGSSDYPSKEGQLEASVARDVRNAIQPEVDALNRAVRRYEKKATTLALQTEARFGAIDTRLNDAIALAAAAAKNSAAQPSFLNWLADSAMAIVLFPVRTVVGLLLLPFTTLLGLITRKKKSTPEKGSRSGRSGKSSSQTRASGDRVPSRVSKR